MTILYKKIDIHGHAEPRACPMCSTCRRVFHPSQLPQGAVVQLADGEEAWTCSIYCRFVLRHGKSAVQRVLATKRDRKPATPAAEVSTVEAATAPLSADVLEKYKGIPGACWADDDDE